MASMSSVTTRGFGNGTFAGSASLVVTLGYGQGAADRVITSADVTYSAPRSLPQYDAFPMRMHYTAPKSTLQYEAHQP